MTGKEKEKLWEQYPKLGEWDLVFKQEVDLRQGLSNRKGRTCGSR